jgi:hypothetical protein
LPQRLDVAAFTRRDRAKWTKFEFGHGWCHDNTGSSGANSFAAGVEYTSFHGSL